MKKRVTYAAVFLFLLAAAFAYAAADKGVSKTDKKFMDEAATGGMLEVQLGQLAQQKGESPDVKNFGSRMVTEHGQANDELKKIAEQKNVSLPRKFESKLKGDVDRLTKLTGGDFDKKYMEAMVKDHTKDVTEFQEAIPKLKDADLKAWTSKTLPVLEDHLKQATDIAQKLGVDVSKAQQEGKKQAKKL